MTGTSDLIREQGESTAQEFECTMTCPDCGDEQADYDGFGVLHCFKCGFCTHAAITGGVCELCGKAAPFRRDHG